MTIADTQINRRRTFAIISHPDAGKTTLTEKLLLYGGAIQLAGSVRARKNQRSASSDWMELEKQRGISVNSTVLQFEYDGYCLNLLDTPGHRDFSEDTYRVLTAVDSVVMVIDAGKGIEPQTRKLFEICRQRGVPIFTFMNKCDRPSRPPLELMDELENVLGIHAYALNWPLGTGTSFKGVYSRLDRQAHYFQKTPGGSYRAPVQIMDLKDASIRDQFDADSQIAAIDELDLLEHAGSNFDEEAIHRGKLTPVLFGSAMNNFGVQMLLDSFVRYGLPPQPQPTTTGFVQPTDSVFSAFVFKIQANMDPRHRDRIVYIRICSGKFEREMSVLVERTGKRINLNSSHRLFGQERETIDEAWPGDIIGIIGQNSLRIGDTLSSSAGVKFQEFPQFAPEVFIYLHNENTAQFKRFRDGLDQLLQEGVVQVITPVSSGGRRVPLLGAVGVLQFDVVQFRLKSEYGADSRIEQTQWTTMRWVDRAIPLPELEAAGYPTGSQLAQDQAGRYVILFDSDWALRYFQDKNPNIRFAITTT